VGSQLRPLLIFLVVIGLATGALILAGGDRYTVTAEVDSAGQLVAGNDVRIGARRVGEVSAVTLSDRGTAEIEMKIDADSAPLMEGTGASIRAASLVGVANRFVVLTPPAGPAPELPDGGRITLTDTTSPVEFDALLNALDAPTRRGLQDLIAGEAQVYEGREREISETLRLVNPALANTTELMAELGRDERALDGVLRYGAAAFTALEERHAELQRTIVSAAAATDPFATEQEALRRAVGALPSTLRQANTTFVNVRGALPDLDRLVATAKPATRDLAPFVRSMVPMLGRASVTVPTLREAVVAPGRSNDLIDLLNALPPLADESETAFPRAIATMDRSQETLDRFRQYTPDIVAALSRLGQTASYYDANGHYVRATPALGALSYDEATNTLGPNPSNNRLGGFETAVTGFCPGAATQPPPDASAPVDVGSCDPLATPPGP
jgi:phospholipid/cholesterol/gamma-HCH transport system substrate-binding protein